MKRKELVIVKTSDDPCELVDDYNSDIPEGEFAQRLATAREKAPKAVEYLLRLIRKQTFNDDITGYRETVAVKELVDKDKLSSGVLYKMKGKEVEEDVYDEYEEVSYERHGYEWTEEDAWDALTDGMYGDMPRNPMDYDAMMDAMGF